VMAMAAELSRRGMKNSTARNSRYRWCPARNTPRRMHSGVCTAHDRAMTTNVTQSECSRPGSARTARQLSKPAGRITPMPSHDVKLRSRTNRSGTMANATKTSRAGSAIQMREPLRLPREVLRRVPGAAGGAAVVTAR
jgi:hypothetical protein